MPLSVVTATSGKAPNSSHRAIRASLKGCARCHCRDLSGFPPRPLLGGFGPTASAQPRTLLHVAAKCGIFGLPGRALVTGEEHDPRFLNGKPAASLIERWCSTSAGT